MGQQKTPRARAAPLATAAASSSSSSSDSSESSSSDDSEEETHSAASLAAQKKASVTQEDSPSSEEETQPAAPLTAKKIYDKGGVVERLLEIPELAVPHEQRPLSAPTRAAVYHRRSPTACHGTCGRDAAAPLPSAALVRTPTIRVRTPLSVDPECVGTPWDTNVEGRTLRIGPSCPAARTFFSRSLLIRVAPLHPEGAHCGSRVPGPHYCGTSHLVWEVSSTAGLVW
eukprot:CAMPEP_0194346416 /NCGR_PEP_ID=MMETSP0171-20130528/105414_1 /TAXON_ID=218684 /ORGANISM="Corethron pennatum, Strain L29A3" /LENGTH=227 /DNA_ID=CAMNT_0039113539 /DNA_START=111 /DNA_END=793 /DNA_ORIENTATION=+